MPSKKRRDDRDALINMTVIHNTKVRWTPKMFEKLVERYVFRTKITEKFRNEISALKADTLLTQGSGSILLKHLFDDENNEMKETYISADKLMQDLYLYQDFPNNAEFFDLGNSLNYYCTLNMYESTRRITFCSIIDAYATFERIIIESKCNKFLPFLAKAIGNWIGRNKKDSFELVSYEIFRGLVNCEEKIRKNMKLDDGFKNRTIEEVYLFLSEYYEVAENELLAQLKKRLEEENEKRPIEKNPQYYEKICANHAFFDTSIRKTFIDSPIAREGFLHGKIATARVFDDKESMNEDRRFFFAKELRNAMQHAHHKQYGIYFKEDYFPVETPEERERGILKIVKWEKYETFLKFFNLPINCIYIVVHEIKKTTRNYQVPINSPYGTYCVLAKDAFLNVLSQVVVGMQLFRRVNEENAPRIIEWFDKLDIFNESHKDVYLIEMRKVDEIIDRAYKELQQYATEPIYKLLKPQYGRTAVLKELPKLAPNFPNPGLLEACYDTCIKYHTNKTFTGRDVHTLYERATTLAFIDLSPKYATFLEKQGVR